MNKKTFKGLIRREALGGGNSLPRGAIGKWLVRNGLTDSIGISSITFISGSAADLLNANFSFDSGSVMLQLDTLEGGDMFFDSADAMAPIARYGYQWYSLLNTSFVWIGPNGIAGYSVSQAANAARIQRYLDEYDHIGNIGLLHVAASSAVTSVMGPALTYSTLGTQYSEIGASIGSVPSAHSDGLLVTPEYLQKLRYSDEIENVAWVKGAGLSVDSTTGEQPAFLPGGKRARKITAVVASGSVSLQHTRPNFVAGTKGTVRCRVKRHSGASWYQLFYYDGGGNQCRAWFNLETGAVGTVAAAGTAADATATIVSIGDGYYDLFLSGVLQATGPYFQLTPRTADASTTSADAVFTICMANMGQMYHLVPYINTTAGNEITVLSAGKIEIPVTAKIQAALGFTDDLLLGVLSDYHYNTLATEGNHQLDDLTTIGTNFALAGVDAIVGLGDTFYAEAYPDYPTYQTDIAAFNTALLSATGGIPKKLVEGNHEAFDTWPDFFTDATYHVGNSTLDLLDDFRLITFSNVIEPFYYADAATLVWLAAALEQARLDSKKVVLASHVRIDENYPGDNFTFDAGYGYAGTATPAATTGNGVTVTIAGYTLTEEDVGHYLCIRHGAVWGSSKIVSYVDPTHVTVDVMKAFGATTAGDQWRIDGYTNISYNSKATREIVEAAKTAGAEILCVLHGHDHYDDSATINGIPYIVFEGPVEFGAVGPLLRISKTGTITRYTGEQWQTAKKVSTNSVITFATLVTVGAASSQVVSDQNILSSRGTLVDLLYLSTDGTVKSSDGTNTASVSILGGYAAGDELLLVGQSNGTTFKVGYKKSGDPAITWGDPEATDGSFNPGKNIVFGNSANTIPLWAAKTLIVNEILADADILDLITIAD